MDPVDIERGCGPYRPPDEVQQGGVERTEAGMTLHLFGAGAAPALVGTRATSGAVAGCRCSSRGAGDAVADSVVGVGGAVGAAFHRSCGAVGGGGGGGAAVAVDGGGSSLQIRGIDNTLISVTKSSVEINIC